MHCTPTNLFVDKMLWDIPGFSEMMLASYKNHTPGDPYDCALASVPCDSNISKGFTGNTVAYWFDVIVVYTILPILSLLGIGGNIINIFIFSRHAIVSDSTNTVLLCMAVVDLIISTNNGAFISTMFLCFVDAELAISAYSLLLLTVYHHVLWLPLLGLDLVTVIALQRAVAVTLPFRVSKIFSSRNTKMIVICLFVFSISTLIPAYISTYEQRVVHPYFKNPIFLSNGYRYSFDQNKAHTYVDMYLLCRSVTGLSILITSVSVTIIKLNQQSKIRKSLKVSNATGGDNSLMSTREMKMVKMSLAVCITTLVLYTIPNIVNVINKEYVSSMKGKDPFETPIIIITFYSAGMTMSAAISCFNFLLYLGMSAQYRDAFISIFSRGQK